MTDYADQLVSALESHGDYSPRTLRFYREQSRLILRVLEEVNPDATPSTMDVDDLKGVIRLVRERYAVSTQRDYMIALKRMCELNNNLVFQQYRVIFPTDTRPNVDWLTYEQAMELLGMWKEPLDEMIVSLELLHGFRRVEVVRLNLDDINMDEGYISVRGKGRAGGKRRIVPMHPDFPATFKRWMEERNSMVARADIGEHCDSVLIYLKGGKLHPYEELKGRAIDNRIQMLTERAGFEFSNHTLRRTFGRELYRSGVEIVIIAVLYGHASTTQTLRYLGLECDDTRNAMDIFRLKKEAKQW